MKKILMITHHDLSDGSGDSARVKKIGHLLEDSFNVEYFGLGHICNLPKMIIKILKTDWDYIYCYNQRYIIMVIFVVTLLKRRKLIYDTLLTWKLQSQGKFRSYTEKLAGNLSDYVITVSELSSNYFKENEFHKSIMIPTLVDTEKFKMDKEKREKIRMKYDISEKNIVVGLIGSFTNEYNRPSLEYLYGNLNKFDKGIKFMLIGKLNDRMGGLIYTGYVQDYVGTLSTLDALLVYRNIPTDGAINRIVEAMSMCIPVFANLVAGMSMESQSHDIFVYQDDELPSKLNEIMLKGNVQGNRQIAERYYSENIYKSKLLEFLK